MRSGDPQSQEFKRRAYDTVIHCKIFKEFLTSFNSKLLPQAAIVTRLETEKKFNEERATEIASVLEDSLKFAGVLDANRNIVPPKEVVDAPDAEDGGSEEDDPESGGSGTTTKQRAAVPQVKGALTLEIALKDGQRAVILYPPDMTTEDATKVGNVLTAVVG